MLSFKILAYGLGPNARCYSVGTPSSSRTPRPRAECMKAFCARKDTNQAYGSWDYDEGSTGQRRGEAQEGLHMTASLLQAAQTLIRYTMDAQVKMKTQLNEQEKDFSKLASAAVTTAEANGALPPMSQAQRKSIEKTLSRVASSMSWQGTDRHHDCGHGDFEGNDLEDESTEVFRGGGQGPYLAPELPELLQELATLELFKGWNAQGGEDTMAAGFQDGLGNISLPKLNSFPWNVDSVTSSVKAPAMGRTERAEMNAESEYMALEVDDFEPHAIAVSEHECESTGEHVVDGDAPAAGDGLQVAGEGEQPQSKMLRRDRPAAADF